MAGSPVTLHGMIMRIRRLSWGGFVILRRHDGLVQCIVSGEDAHERLRNLEEEQSVSISGVVKEASIKDPSINPGNVEIHVDGIEVISSPGGKSPVDLSKKILDLHIDNNLDLRPRVFATPWREPPEGCRGNLPGFQEYIGDTCINGETEFNPVDMPGPGPEAEPTSFR
jgi:nondiscriminating aspartyl-tRNA synthetase